MRDWIHVDDHNDAVVAILEQGRLGETYLIGADGEQNNREIVALILELMGKPADWFDHVTDRPGHDLRYAIDSSQAARRARLDARATRLPRRAWPRRSTWYRDNEDWWRPQKDATEAKYARTQQVVTR